MKFATFYFLTVSYLNNERLNKKPQVKAADKKPRAEKKLRVKLV